MEATPHRPALVVAVVGERAQVDATLAAAEIVADVPRWSASGESPAAFVARCSTTSTLILATGSANEIARFETELGWNSDVRVEAGDPAAPAALRRALADFGEWTRLGLWGGAAGGVEMGIGSLLHAARVPLRGLALCSVQAALMTFASASLARPGRVLWVPLISAGLKAFSPGGGRVRPMVAISVQGALFAGSVQTLGWNPVALALGGALVGAWAALQGFFLQYLLLGSQLVEAYERLVTWLAQTWQITSPSLPWLLAGWTVLHALSAGSLALFAWKLRAPPARLRAVLERHPAQTAKPTSTPASPASRLRREFARWQFWLPLAVVVSVLALAGSPAEELAWLALRFVVVGFLFFALLSLFQPARFAARLRRWGWWGPAAAFSRAFSRHAS